MENEEIVVADDSNTAEEVDLDITENTEETVEETEDVDWKTLAQKEKERADNLKIRAEKAERLAKATPKAQESVASRDLIALMNAKVHEDDISEVEDYAKYRGISIAEALKTNMVKTILAEKAEQRNVAIATNTGPARKGSVKLSDDTLLKNASEGKLSDDVDALVAARFNSKRK